MAQVSADMCKLNWDVILPHKVYEQVQQCQPLCFYMYIHASVVQLLAHYQVLCYCRLAKPDPHTKSKTLFHMIDCLHAWKKCDGS